MKTVLAAILTLAMPAAATAACGTWQAGSAVRSCEQGVMVFRQTPLVMPRLTPAQAAQIELQRERLALQKLQASQSFALESRRLDQSAENLRQQDYLYRDANSPLRYNAFGPYGFAGLNAGYTAPRIAVVGRVAPRRRH